MSGLGQGSHRFVKDQVIDLIRLYVLSIRLHAGRVKSTFSRKETAFAITGNVKNVRVSHPRTKWRLFRWQAQIGRSDSYSNGRQLTLLQSNLPHLPLRKAYADEPFARFQYAWRIESDRIVSGGEIEAAVGTSL